jgi:hypothetical protein
MAEPTGNFSFITTALEYGAAFIGLLVGIIYKKHETDIKELSHMIKMKLDKNDYQEDQERAEVQRKELREGLIKIFDKLEQHGRDTQSKFDLLMQTTSQQHISLLVELSSKADK